MKRLRFSVVGRAAFAALVVGTLAVDSAGQEIVTVAELEPATPVLGDKLGHAVALEGNRLVVGRPGPTAAAGAVDVYEDTGQGFVRTATLTGSGIGPDGDFGRALDLEGDTLAILADSFVLFVFEEVGGTWSETARLVPAGGPYDFGLPQNWIDLDGDTIAVGHCGTAPSDPNAVFVFERGPSGWPHATETVLSGSGSLDFGFGVSLDGGRLAVGDGSGVFLYRRTNGVWQLEATIPSPLDPFSYHYYPSLEGSRLAVSVGNDDEVQVFEEQAGAWSLAATVTPSNQAPALWFGFALELNGDRLVVGAPHENADGLPNAGAGGAYLFARDGSAWNEIAHVEPDDLTNKMELGTAVSLDGTRFAVGAPFKDSTVPNSGAALVYDFVPPTPTVYCTPKTTSTGCVPSIGWTGSGASLTGADDFGIVCEGVSAQKTGLFFFGTSGPAALPFLGGTLCVQPGLTRTLPQPAVGGSPCSAAYAFAFTQVFMATVGLDPGTDVHGQWWMRDPQHPDGTGVALSDGLAWQVGP